jgi:porin
MHHTKSIRALTSLTALLLSIAVPPVLSAELTEDFSINGLLAGGYQYLDVTDAPGYSDVGRGAVPFQMELGYTPNPHTEFGAKLGFAAGNGLNDEQIWPFASVAWAANLEDDVKNINGRNRDYLLTAWYKRSFEFGQSSRLGFVGGIIDASVYLNDNAYANDEYTQFLSDALVNAPNAFLPSYDIGAAVEWRTEDFVLSAVIMNVGLDDSGRTFNYHGIEFDYHLKIGERRGTYRLLSSATSNDFEDAEGNQNKRQHGFILSCDQELTGNLGAWIRFGWQTDKAVSDYDDIYSGGIDIGGAVWGRDGDNIGLAYAFLDGEFGGIRHTHLIESYYRLVFDDHLAGTADIQYIQDHVSEGDDASGLVFGLRLVAEF